MINTRKHGFTGKNSVRIDEFINKKGTFDAEYGIIQNEDLRGKIFKTFNDLIKLIKKTPIKTIYFNIPFYIEENLKSKKYWFRTKVLKRKIKSGEIKEYLVIEKQEKNIDTNIREYTQEGAKFMKFEVLEENEHFMFFDDEVHDFDDEYIKKGIEDNKFQIANFNSELDEIDIDIEELDKN